MFKIETALSCKITICTLFYLSIFLIELDGVCSFNVNYSFDPNYKGNINEFNNGHLIYRHVELSFIHEICLTYFSIEKGC